MGAIILTVSAPASGLRDGAANFMTYWLMLVSLGFIGALILPGLIAYVVRHDREPDDVINDVRVAQIVMIAVVVWLWGWTPDSLPGDPGDRYPSSSSPGVRHGYYPRCCRVSLRARRPEGAL